MKKQIVILLIVLSAALSGYAQDWPNLKRYQAANEKLKDSTITAVFIVDSITDFWLYNDSTFFRTYHYADRGISAQTSPQMLLRFRQDVIGLHPKAVVILCGTNDLSGNTGPMTLEMTEDNIQSMAELAKVHRIKVILCAVMPVTDAKGGRPADQIIALNAWIKAYAGQNHFRYVDYYSSMVDAHLNLKEEYTKDGLHPNKDGYWVMENLVQVAITKAL
jgi:lysophospholipase L1-like esterase